MGRVMTLLRNIKYLSNNSLWKQRENDILYFTNKILSDGIYEYGFEELKDPNLKILDKDQTIDLLLNNPKSFVRTGDGEIKLMMGQDQPFQRYEKEIADRLISCLHNDRDDMYVGLNRNYFIPLGIGEADFYRRYAYDFRQFYTKYCKADSLYIDSTFTAYDFSKNPKNIAVLDRYNKIKLLFKGKDIVVICGNGILDKLDHDIFDFCESKSIIGAPAKNAWDEHKSVISKIKNEYSKDVVIVFILGMAGKAMIPELTDMGYMAWDVGHLAKYYHTLMMGKILDQNGVADFYAPD